MGTPPQKGKKWLSWGQSQSVGMFHALCLMMEALSCYLWVGKYLEVCRGGGVEPREGGLWGGQGPQKGLIPYRSSSKGPIFFRVTDVYCLDISCYSRRSPGPTGWLTMLWRQLFSNGHSRPIQAVVSWALLKHFLLQ